MVNSTSRRAVLGAMATTPVALIPLSAQARPAPPSNPRWTTLVSDYRSKRAVWLATCGAEDDMMPVFKEACAALPPEPQQPGSGLPNDITQMTIAQIKAAGTDPALKAAWAQYEHDHAAWAEERDALKARIVGPAKARNADAHKAYAAAFDALTKHRVTTLSALREKIEVIAADYDGCDIPPEYFQDVLSDVRHFARKAS